MNSKLHVGRNLYTKQSQYFWGIYSISKDQISRKKGCKVVLVNPSIFSKYPGPFYPLLQVLSPCSIGHTQQTHFHTANDARLSTHEEKDVFQGQPKSWLFVSDAVAGAYGSQVNLQLDLKSRLMGEDLEKLKKNITARRMDDINIEQLVSDHAEFENFFAEVEALENKMKEFQQLLSDLKMLEKSSETEERISGVIEELRSTRKHVATLNESLWPLEEKVMHSALRLPNTLHSQTPMTDDELVVKEQDSRKDLSDCTRSHVDVGRAYNLIKFSNVGPKAYYLRGQLTVAERLLSDTMCESLQSQGFRLTAGPEFFKSPILEGCGRDFWDTKQVLTLKHVSPIIEPMNHLAGVSPMSFVAFLARCCVGDNSLPFRMMNCGRAYQNSELPGLFGAVQSTQVGVFSCASASQIKSEFDTISDLIWNHLSSLGFKLRICQIGASKLRCEEAQRLNFEMFSPYLQQYVPIAHVSDLSDFISRRLMILHNLNHGDFRQGQLVHMVSGTALNITSLLALWMEHSDCSRETFNLCKLPGLENNQ